MQASTGKLSICRWLLLVLTLLLLAACQPQRCAIGGGRWASAQARCISPKCAADASCGLRVAPMRYCSKLTLGDSKAQVYFWLGQPGTENQQHSIWLADKASDEMIKAVFNDAQQLVRLECPTAAAN